MMGQQRNIWAMNSLRLKRLVLEAGVVLVCAEGNPLEPEVSEPNKSPKRSGPGACREEATPEPTAEPLPIPNGSNRSPMAATQTQRAGKLWQLRTTGTFLRCCSWCAV